MRPFGLLKAVASVALVCCCLVALVACSGSESGQVVDEETRPEEVLTYSVRGRVLELFDGEKLAVRHEEVPDLVGVGGETEPMAEMSMRFPVADTVAASALAVGDLIAFEMTVDWSRRPPHRIEGLEQLPLETPLNLER